jgi:hypothetical protein
MDTCNASLNSRQSLVIDPNNARKLYPSASTEFKAMLEDSFGKAFFSMKIIDGTPTVEAALAIAGTRLSEIVLPSDRPDVGAYKVLTAVIAVLNEDWKADHTNKNQVKYEPTFVFDKAKGGFVYGGYYYRWHQRTYVGSRLCYRDYETMMHGVAILKDYYKIYLSN